MVLDLVFGRLGDDHALGVEAGAARAAGYLVELARAQAALLVAVELGESGEQHGMDGHVDAHAQGVGAADDGQQALLGELFDQQAVSGQQPRVMQAHAAGDEVLERLAKRRGEAPALDGFLDGLALLLGGHAVTRQRAGARERGVLREVDYVQRRVALSQRELDRALEAGLDVFVRERHGARGIGDGLNVATGVTFERLRDGGHVAQRGAHEHELGVR